MRHNPTHNNNGGLNWSNARTLLRVEVATRNIISYDYHHQLSCNLHIKRLKMSMLRELPNDGRTRREGVTVVSSESMSESTSVTEYSVMAPSTSSSMRY
eukprot:2758405-Rhodomonas_salina.1